MNLSITNVHGIYMKAIAVLSTFINYRIQHKKQVIYYMPRNLVRGVIF